MQLSVTTCPQWEYKDVPGHDQILSGRATAVLAQIRRQGDPTGRVRLIKDTRSLHAQMFIGLTPPGHDYYAGNYRGDPNFRCLTDYEVTIQGNPIVGHPANVVSVSLADFANSIDLYIHECDLIAPLNEQVMGRADKIARTVYIAVALFSYFLEIHPFANGNGHISRFLLLLALARYGIYPIRWPIHPRPQDPPYSMLIHQFQNGNREPLVAFGLSCI